MSLTSCIRTEIERAVEEFRPFRNSVMFSIRQSANVRITRKQLKSNGRIETVTPYGLSVDKKLGFPFWRERSYWILHGLRTRIVLYMCDATLCTNVKPTFVRRPRAAHVVRRISSRFRPVYARHNDTG